MSKPKFASLTAGLLARKGDAAPALQTASILSGLAKPPAQSQERLAAPIRRDCAEDRPAIVQPSHAVESEPSVAARTLAVHLPVFSGPQRRTAVTVRLDEARYLRLKLTGARSHRTNQDILVKAIDTYLDSLGVEEIETTIIS